MIPADLSRLRQPGALSADPSGTRVALAVSTPDIDDDAYSRAIWVADGDGANQFTAGPRDSAPDWSPDGRNLAFLRAPENGKPSQVAVMPIDGGEPRMVTDFEHGVESLQWSPDGLSLAVTAVTPDEGWQDLDEDETKRKPRRITSIPYRFDNMGWLDDRRRHIWLVDPSGETEPRCLTPGPFDETLPAWSPDGSRIAFLTDRDPARGLSAGIDVFEVDVNTGEQSRAAGRGLWALASYRQDGTLHLLGSPDLDFPILYTLHRREADGSLTDLSGHLDRSSVSLAAGPPFLAWDGDQAIVGVEDSGRVNLARVAPDGAIAPVTRGNRVITAADSAGGVVFFAATTWDNPGDLYTVAGGEERRLTDLNNTGLELTEPEHFRVESDGHEIDAWAVVPDGEEPLPLLLNIHGGPASQYGFGFFDEFQVYASAGYGVIACNPRGSSGRGLEFARAVTGDGWGRVDMADIDAVVAAALERYPRLDPTRMGVMGGSYGGFMTAWIIAHQERWASAVVERALTNFVSFGGTSDIAGTFPYSYTRADYPDWETWWAKSPLAHVDRVRTPTLVIHSENDFRCPIEQGEQFFTALLRNGTPTELVRFPGEGHELTRSGKPRHRAERFEIVLDWHARHLA